ncbi:N-acetylmuramoyl-L-alanine amidase [Salipiger abyssi]|uniref:1,6-anhydro-N-acetylmuramyl-L-alanine amidase AmpD n=1 Tax=Salipiger abyssi TaxID=1250539 RepID=A0A1P8UXQ6_9RHOB|nr:N-acetylmuramoyl-L-alanine amidase [Salipiger abyssi]ALF02121.1 N-acetylmuramoyl-L-alanine amidase [Pelagibaca phage vB_PeaS-P1]APZ54136.1 N-acetylmuramoyl-L-alanine amidase [Salipiger abyssi]
MRIINHRLKGVDFWPAHFTGGEIVPEIVVLHDTAGRLENGNSARYLASENTGKASVHFVVERDATVRQLVPTNCRANHAGRSNYHGREWCNGFSIGIEIVNPGRMTGDASEARAWWGETFSMRDEYDLAKVATPEHGDGVWMAYTEAQITAVISLLECLFRDVPTLTDITTHWYVSPGRKVDTNPLFPLEHIRARVLGRNDPADLEAEKGSDPSGDETVEIETHGDTLNMRRWPSFNPNVIAAIPDGTVVPVIRKGTFAGRKWLRVLYGGQEGWIVARYAAPITYHNT